MAEDGRPSERGHIGRGCWSGLLLIPFVLLRLALMHLHPTPTRIALLKAIRDGGGRIYFEAGEVWDKALAWRVTDKVRQMLAADWIRALEPDEPRGPGEMKTRTYYRLKPAGDQILEGR